MKEKKILLWCYDPFFPNSKASKRPHDGDGTAEPSAKAGRSRLENALQKKMSKVEEVFDSLPGRTWCKWKSTNL